MDWTWICTPACHGSSLCSYWTLNILLVFQQDWLDTTNPIKHMHPDIQTLSTFPKTNQHMPTISHFQTTFTYLILTHYYASHPYISNPPTPHAFTDVIDSSLHIHMPHELPALTLSNQNNLAPKPRNRDSAMPRTSLAPPLPLSPPMPARKFPEEHCI